MTFTNSDGEALVYIAAALERIAAAEERRNKLIEAEAIERRAAWRESEERSNAALARLLGQPGAGPADPWRDLPEHQP